MTREVKFRGQRTDTKEWVYGYYAHTTLSDDGLCLGDCMKHHLIIDSGVYYEVIPETVGQYTGLKDKNDKEIYEGDIVKYKRINGSFEYGKISYNGCAFDIDNSWNLQVFVARGLEVIGNIYEDSNLL